MLINKQLSSEMQSFIKRVNSMPVEDQDAAIQQYCDRLESSIYNAIRSITITILPGQITVVGAQGPSSNVLPIVLEQQVK